mgnify:CR=1 FL=1
MYFEILSSSILYSTIKLYKMSNMKKALLDYIRKFAKPSYFYTIAISTNAIFEKKDQSIKITKQLIVKRVSQMKKKVESYLIKHFHLLSASSSWFISSLRES